MKKVRACEGCGNEFAAKPSTDPQSVDGFARYCSRGCFTERRKQRAAETTVDRFWSKVDKSAGPERCWPWTAGKDEDGYGKFSYRDQGRRIFVRAHRFAYEIQGQPLGAELCACHTCDNPPCCNPAHLFPGTNEANTQDSVEKGRRSAGEKSCPSRLLTDDEVRAIRTAAAGGESHESIAARYPVQRRQISRIAQGTRYAWVT